ncbi:hypothetical protein BIFGAL_03279 [Bifidobacterium gallicum DSM 20093 = LMG 11596]|uniref:Uncharacterized protein n=1 Tax=Bifidobacterium gallicum DSM 20093 = LMG 11596 TaxID=561180 RepID=D1NTV8_9BIFI|nr:hypothetical protein BIFGAL_03279 [Bifidobacterium gallicum DSM 20093 = LMG 11596]
MAWRSRAHGSDGGDAPICVSIIGAFCRTRRMSALHWGFGITHP